MRREHLLGHTGSVTELDDNLLVTVDLFCPVPDSGRGCFSALYAHLLEEAALVFEERRLVERAASLGSGDVRIEVVVAGHTSSLWGPQWALA